MHTGGGGEGRGGGGGQGFVCSHKTNLFVHISFCWNSNFILVPFFSAQCKTKTVKKADGSCACGFAIEDGLMWKAASDKCKSLGGRLPEIRSEQENIDVISLIVSVFYIYLCSC